MANSNADPDAIDGSSTANNSNNNTAAANTSALRKSVEDLRKPSTTTAQPAIPSLKTSTAASTSNGSSNTAASNHLNRVASPSPASSPHHSRNASPIRSTTRNQPLSNPISTQPSAAAIQRALSATNPPTLQQGAVTDSVSKLPRAPRSAGTSTDGTSQWPTSPRVKSPPPSGSSSRRNSSTGQKKVDAGSTPNINVQNAAPQSPSSAPPTPKATTDDAPRANSLQVSSKGPSRGPSGKSTLETVQENSADDAREPSPAALAAAADLRPLTKVDEEENSNNKRENGMAEADKPTAQAESGSESAGTRSPRKKDQGLSTQRPRNAQSKSYAALSSTKGRQADAKQSVTVETETVPSVPQSAINIGDRSGAGRGDPSGSIKQKPSSEAIRPKKERKKTTNKARSINQSTASSKADIFEQRVANAVDEANSSESEETFVYESNPPEQQRRARHHSRTPSVTSANSVAEQQRAGIRNFGDVMDDSRRVGGKRSMKFSNNAFNDADVADGPDGSVRSSHTPRHFGRFGRGGSQQSMFDPDSPFTQASRLRSTQRSSPKSPRASHGGQQRSSGLFGRKQEPSYDFDAEVGDDERTPLVGTVRTQRAARIPSRRLQQDQSIDEYYSVRRQGRCGRYSGCMLAMSVLAAVLISTVIFLIMSNRPLYDVEILNISNVLASEQELILDLTVSAVNPNALGITITDIDLDIFAKSKNVGSGGGGGQSLQIREESSARRRRRKRRSVLDELDGDSWASATKGGVDKGTDPPDENDDLERDAQTMLLGRVYHFDQPLTFEASPIKRYPHHSKGELRLEQPGNKTETGGSARWERVLQADFQLIVRGSLKYQLPISSRLQSVAVGKAVVVHPHDESNDPGDSGGNVRVGPIDENDPERWQWIDWSEVEEVPTTT